MHQDSTVRPYLTRLLRIALVCSAVLGFAFSIPTASSAAHAAQVVFGDSLAPGWSDWSWNTQIDWQDTTNPHTGTNDVAFTFTGPWDGLSVHSDAPVDTNPYDQVQFWINGGAAGGQKALAVRRILRVAEPGRLSISPHI